jgi:hypothetical protein
MKHTKTQIWGKSQLNKKYHWGYSLQTTEVAKILNEILVITVNFNVTLYSDCQLANVLYHYNHICIIVFNMWRCHKIDFFYLFWFLINWHSIHYCNFSCNIVCLHDYILYTCILLDVWRMLQTVEVPEWYCINLNIIIYQIKSNLIKSKQYESRVVKPAWYKMALPPNLQSSHRKCLNLCMWLSSKTPLPTLYVMNLGKTLIFHLAKYGMWVDKPSVHTIIPCILIKLIDMVYYKNNTVWKINKPLN